MAALPSLGLSRSTCSCLRKCFPPPLLRRKVPVRLKGHQAEGRSGGQHRLTSRQPARTRFAPSPTGYLHLGSLRTALYNYLIARATKGQFLLRLEDTDQTRLVDDAESRLYDDLRWAGLEWDEGPDCGGPLGPYKQSARLSLYHEHAQRLVSEGRAFRCFCSTDDLAAAQGMSEAGGNIARPYPGVCLGLSAEESADKAASGAPHTIRFRGGQTPVGFRDLVYGIYRKRHPEDHFIIMKSDGFPTYHFANVVDDHLMGITHVVRGAEWLISTPKHVALYDAFGWDPPQFAHVGLLVDARRQKLSKRNQDIGIDAYRRDNVPAAALLNFAVLLGWSSRKGVTEVMTLQDMVEKFTLDFTRGDIGVDPGKLEFFRKKHFRLMLAHDQPGSPSLDELLIRPVLDRVRDVENTRRSATRTDCTSGEPAGSLLDGVDSPVPCMRDLDGPAARSYVYRAAKISRDAGFKPDDVVEATKFLLWRPSRARLLAAIVSLEEATINSDGTSVLDVVAVFAEQLGVLGDSEWTRPNLEPAITNAVGEAPVQGKGVAYHTLRCALLGSPAGPQIIPLLELLGREETMLRLESAREVAEGLRGQDMSPIHDGPSLSTQHA